VVIETDAATSSRARRWLVVLIAVVGVLLAVPVVAGGWVMMREARSNDVTVAARCQNARMDFNRLVAEAASAQQAERRGELVGESLADEKQRLRRDFVALRQQSPECLREKDIESIDKARLRQ
jgi:flagellar basal body-associated protein FliL